MEENNVILLLSGGVDSTTLLAKLSCEGKNIFALSFDYGQRNLIELDYAKANAQKYCTAKHNIIKIDNTPFKSQSSLTNFSKPVSSYIEPCHELSNEYVPSRNLLFLSHAAAYAETIKSSNIYVGFNMDDSRNFPDCSSAFIDCFNNLLSVTGTWRNPIRVNAPFIQLTKGQVLELASALNVDLSKTISCYSPVDGMECGTCLSCVTKQL